VLLFCNRRFAEIIEQPLEGVVGKRLFDFLAPETRASLEALLNFISALPYQFGNESVGRTGVRRTDDVGYTVLNGHLRHRTGDFERFGAVIETGKYVAMNINHQRASIAHEAKRTQRKKRSLMGASGKVPTIGDVLATYTCESAPNGFNLGKTELVRIAKRDGPRN